MAFLYELYDECGSNIPKPPGPSRRKGHRWSDTDARHTNQHARGHRIQSGAQGGERKRELTSSRGSETPHPEQVRTGWRDCPKHQADNEAGVPSRPRAHVHVARTTATGQSLRTGGYLGKQAPMSCMRTAARSERAADHELTAGFMNAEHCRRRLVQGRSLPSALPGSRAAVPTSCPCGRRSGCPA
jgi:hypothetical protein